MKFITLDAGLDSKVYTPIMNGRKIGLWVGEVAARALVKPDTVRFYEEAGLLAPANRSTAGYRRFPEETVARIRFIKRAQTLGFTLKEIAVLLDLRLRAGDSCGPVQMAAQTKIAEIDGKIASLRRLRRGLTRFVKACRSGNPTGNCPLLESLEGEQNER